MLRYKTQTRPGLVALYDIRPGNGAGQFLQPRSTHGAWLMMKLGWESHCHHYQSLIAPKNTIQTKLFLCYTSLSPEGMEKTGKHRIKVVY